MTSGITYRQSTTRLGAVPEYEEREAARFGLYRWVDWERLPVAERVRGLAHYRMHHLIELHQADAQADRLEQERKANDRTGRRRIR